MKEKSKSKFVKHGPCPECGSKDNLAWFDDGHATCFGCDYQYQPTKDKPEPMPVLPMKKPDLIDQCRIISKALTKRGLQKKRPSSMGMEQLNATANLFKSLPSEISWVNPVLNT